MDKAQAFAHCRRLAQTHYENFTVGSWLLPKDKRAHVFNLYAYARSVDDLGDESEGDRLKRLDDWERQLRECYTGRTEHPVFAALQHTIQEFSIPIDPFLRLIEANRTDQTRSRYETFDDLRDYCVHSANPCGHLFLYVFGYRDKARQSLSDYTCTALQLTNFWQDIAIDYGKARIYIPQEDLRRFNVAEEDIASGRVNGNFIELMKFEIERTRDLFRRGEELARHVSRSLRLDIRLFTRGGMKLLDAIEANGYDVFQSRPKLSKSTKTWLMVGALLG